MVSNVVILLDEDGFVAVNKPSGMLCEGGCDREEDLEQAVSSLLGREVTCCHRLDRLTSGLVVLRKGKKYSKELAAQFEGGKLRKAYWMLVDGIWDRRIQKIETQIAPVGKGVWANVESGGKAATSTFRLLGVDEQVGVSWVSGLLKTGRTHQLRLHAQKAGCPILGDPLYGEVRKDGVFGLHARNLRMRHPGSGESIELVAEPPIEWKAWLERFD